jgi:predicted DNA-binding transcriptional regulator YafY
VNFTDAEVSGLAAAVAAHRGQPFDSHARAALVKALSVMDTHARERATALTARVWIDHTDTPSDARARHTIEQALHEQRVLVVHYRDRHGKQTTRRIDPVLLARTQGQWYLVGHCRTRQAIRWLRLDRVSAAHLTTESALNIAVEAVGTPPATAEPVAVR